MFCSLCSNYVFFCWAWQYIFFCWAWQVIIFCFVVCFRTMYFFVVHGNTYSFVGHSKWFFVWKSVFGLHIFLSVTTSDYFLFVVCFLTTYIFVRHYISCFLRLFVGHENTYCFGFRTTDFFLGTESEYLFCSLFWTTYFFVGDGKWLFVS